MHSGQVNSLHLSIGPQGLFLGSSGRLPCFFFFVAAVARQRESVRQRSPPDLMLDTFIVLSARSACDAEPNGKSKQNK